MLRIGAAKVQNPAGPKQPPKNSTNGRIVSDVLQGFVADDLVECIIKPPEVVEIYLAKRQSVLADAEKVVVEFLALRTRLGSIATAVTTAPLL